MAGLTSTKVLEFRRETGEKLSKARISAGNVWSGLRQRPPVRWLSSRPLFAWLVVFPTLLSILYFGFIASDIYTSESSFVIRSPQQSAARIGGLGSMISSAVGGFAEAPTDAMAVSDFILSRDALREINEKFDLKAYFSQPDIDWFHRFGLFGIRNNFENFYEYYRRRISVMLAAQGAITHLSVSAFAPDMALQMNESLLELAEKKVNQLNDRARQDLIVHAEREVKEAEKRIMAAALALSNFRDTQEVMDPEMQTAFHFELIGKMQTELVATLTQLAQIQTLAPQSPAPLSLELKAKTIREEINRELATIAGGDRSLSRIAADFEQYAIMREFAQQQLAVALASLQGAKDEAQRQQLYLERIANPNLPDAATLPRRLHGIVTTILVTLVSWGILTMLMAGIREHQNY
jgi:capsular polysaccharide transport system permease protein